MSPTSQQRPGPREKREIKYFAFLDFETTGLRGSPRITELSILACSKNQFLEYCSGDIPRVINKLTLCFNPFKLIEQEAANISGLNNFQLENENSLNKNAGSLLVNFLNHLLQPVCIVAHNGNKFDFPILKEALKKINVAMPDNIYYVDSLDVIKDIDKMKEEKELYGKLLEEDSILLADIDLENILKSQQEKPTSSKATNWQKRNETTPKRPTYPENIARIKRLISNRDISDDEEIEEVEINRNKKVRRGIFSSSNLPRTPVIKSDLHSFPPSYSLSAIYERRFQKEFDNAHRAENDVLALLEVALSYGEFFVLYAEKAVFGRS